MDSNTPQNNSYNNFGVRTTPVSSDTQVPPIIEAEPLESTDRVARQQRHTIGFAYMQMGIGLAITAVTAVVINQFGLLDRFLMSFGTLGMIGIIIAQLAIAFALPMRIATMSTATAYGLFYAYSVLMGFTMSSIFTVYPIANIAVVFALTAVFFLALTMIGFTTKVNLLGFGSIFSVALIVLIIAEVVLMLFHVPGSTMAISALGLLLFAGLTAYDAQKTRAYYRMYAGNPGMLPRVSILCALTLYLDFINMFYFLLNLLGQRE